MSKFNYSEEQQELNNVLKYQDEQLKELLIENASRQTSTDYRIKLLERKIKERGGDLKRPQGTRKTKRTIVTPTWSHLTEEAKACIGNDTKLEDMLSEDELKSNQEYIVSLKKEYNQIQKLDKIDITIAALAGIIAGAMDILMVGIPHRTKEGLKAGYLSDYLREYFDKILPPEEMEKLANSKLSKVPFDAQDNRNTAVRVEGLSAYYHRLLQLGHDPVIGFVVGVMDIMTGRMTTIDKKGQFVSQKMANYNDRIETNVFRAIAKELMHLKSDVTTSMGLPAPLMGLFNLFQFGIIGEEEQTIAEIVQGMYYEGYDFIQFCSSSIPVMVVEVLVRICYSIKRISEGNKIKDSIPFSLDRNKHPKLETMLFIAHSASTAINAGKVAFTSNPVAINYPQWIRFAKIAYKQLLWMVIRKSNARENYIQQSLNERYNSIINELNASYDEFTSENFVVLI